MATQYNLNANGTSNLTNWSATGACTITATADGVRVVKSTSGAGAVRCTLPNLPPGGFKYSMGSMAIRRNTPGSAWPSVARFAYTSSTGISTLDQSLGNGFVPVGAFVALPMLRNGVNLDGSGSTFYIELYGGGAYDITIKNLYVYKQAELTADGLPGAVIDGNDTAFTATVPTTSLQLTVAASDPNEYVDSLTWDWGDGTSTSGPANVRTRTKTYSTAGQYTVKCTGSNYDGQTASSAQPITIPSGVFDADFTYSTNYKQLTVDASPSQSAGNNIGTYTWEWGDGTTTTGKTASKVYANAGTYNVKLTISNSLGQNNSETKSIQVLAPPNPNLTFTADQNLLTAKFFPSVTTSGTTYSWNFGDGGTSTLQNPTRVYAVAGTYTVTLTINGSTSATRSIVVKDTYQPLRRIADALRLEVAQNPGDAVIWNRTPNPNGEQGAYGWATPVSGSLVDSSNTSGGPYDKGFAGYKLWYQSSGSGAQYFQSAPVSVTAGQYAAAAVTIPYIDGYARLTMDALDASSVVLGSSATTGYLVADSNLRTTPYLLPTNTKFVRLRVQFTSDTGSGVPALNKILMFNQVMIATAAASADLTSLVYLETVEWINILGPTHEIVFEKEPLEVGPLSATILDASLDPAVSSTIRPGARLRLRVNTADDQGNSIWESLYTGKVDEAEVTYERDRIIPAIPSSTEAVVNGAMTSGLLPWKGLAYAYPWLNHSATSDGLLIGATNKTGSGVQYAFYQKVKVSPGRTYVGSFRARRNSGSQSQSLRVTIRAFDANDNDLGSPSGSTSIATLLGNSGDSSWVTHTLNFGTIPSNAVNVNIWFMDYGASGQSWSYNVTDVTVTESYTIPARSSDPKKTRIVLTALDAMTVLANEKERRGVGKIADLPLLLEGVAVPYQVNNSGAQVPNAAVVSMNDEASLLDQIAIARDTDSGYVHVDRNGVLVANDTVNVSPVVTSLLDGSAYSDVDATFSTKELINSVIIKWLRYEASTGNTTEIQYGPYEDTASIAIWGVAQETFTIQGTSENPTAIAAKGNAILAANATPKKQINSLTIPIRYKEDLTPSRALLDLMDLVRVTHEQTGIDQNLRVTQIRHVITPEFWSMQVGFNTNGSVARPVATPSPVVFANVAGLAIELPNAINLNSYVQPGSYAQTANAEAASGLNYPVPQAGWLEVAANVGSTMVWQRYTVYNSGAATGVTAWVRSFYAGAWSAWKASVPTAAIGLARLNAATSLANASWTTITAWTAEETVGLNYASGVWTTQVAGLYRIHFTISFQTNATGIRGVRPFVNGAAQLNVLSNPTSGFQTSVDVQIVARLAQGATVACQAYQSSGAALNMLGDTVGIFSKADIAKIGD